MKKFLFSVCMLALLAFSAEEARAQVSFGAHANWSSEVDFGLGARASVALPVEKLSVVPSLDIFFPSTGVPGSSMSWMELNGNLHYAFSVASMPTITPYAGGGLNIARVSSKFDFLGEKYSGSDTKAGLNILGGVDFGSIGKVKPFAELRFATIADGHLILTSGVHF